MAGPLADLGRLRVAAVEIRRVEMALRRPVATAHGAVRVRTPVLVRVVGADGEEGWGECAAEDTPGYWHEYADACEQVLRRFVVPVMDGADIGVADVPAVGGWPMATAAVECAVVDALCRRSDTSVAAWLGATRTSVEATITLDASEVAAGAADGPAGSYRNVKVKVRPGVDVDWVALAGRRVSADANGSLTVDGVAALAGTGLDHLEQPLPADDLVAHAALRRVVPSVPVALDEPVRSAADVRTIAALGAADVVVLKPGRVGGFLAARRVHDAAVAAGLRVKVGGMWDTGIGRAAALAVAGLPGCSVPPDLAAADRYWDDDVVVDPAVLDAEGRLTVPDGPGLGIEVRLPA